MYFVIEQPDIDVFHLQVILSTNIAESSITVPDIKYVIDFCLTKCMVCDMDTNYQVSNYSIFSRLLAFKTFLSEVPLKLNVENLNSPSISCYYCIKCLFLNNHEATISRIKAKLSVPEHLVLLL